MAEDYALRPLVARYDRGPAGSAEDGPEQEVGQDSQACQGQEPQNYIKTLYSGCGLRHGSSSSGSSGRKGSCRWASSTMRRLSATSGVS